MSTWGIHLVWTCYMTWPPGDDRGHWSPLFDLYGRLIDRGHKLGMPDRSTRVRAASLAREPKMVLSPAAMRVVADTLGGLVGDDLRIHAAAIEPTHVHLLISPPREALARVVGRIKGRTSSAVLALPEHTGRSRTWTTKFWRVFCYDDDAALVIARYIEDHNERRGLSRSPHSWLDPI